MQTIVGRNSPDRGLGVAHIVLGHDAKLTRPRMRDKRANRVFSLGSELELMPPGLRGGALLFQHVGFFFIQCGH